MGSAAGCWLPTVLGSVARCPRLLGEKRGAEELTLTWRKTLDCRGKLLCLTAAWLLPVGTVGIRKVLQRYVTCSDDGENPEGHSRQNSEERKTWSEKKATLKGHWKAPALGEHSCLGCGKGGWIGRLGCSGLHVQPWDGHNHFFILLSKDIITNSLQQYMFFSAALWKTTTYWSGQTCKMSFFSSHPTCLDLIHKEWGDLKSEDKSEKDTNSQTVSYHWFQLSLTQLCFKQGLRIMGWAGWREILGLAFEVHLVKSFRTSIRFSSSLREKAWHGFRVWSIMILGILDSYRQMPR